MGAAASGSPLRVEGVMDLAQAIDYSAPNFRGDGAAACRAEIVRYVQGIRGKRRAPVTAAQIVNWLRATPAEFVHAEIAAACAEGRIRCVARTLGSHRRSRGAYVYEIIEEKGP